MVGLLYLSVVMGITFGGFSQRDERDSSLNFPFAAGADCSIFFWHARWRSHAPLRELFLISMLPMDKDAFLAYYWKQASNTSTLSPVFVRDGFADDDIVINFFKKLNDAKLGDSPHDLVRWDSDLKEGFIV